MPRRFPFLAPDGGLDDGGFQAPRRSTPLAPVGGLPVGPLPPPYPTPTPAPDAGMLNIPGASQEPGGISDKRTHGKDYHYNEPQNLPTQKDPHVGAEYFENIGDNVGVDDRVLDCGVGIASHRSSTYSGAVEVKNKEHK